MRATIKIEGTHILAKTGRTLLPFVVRLYFYAGQASIRMVHSIVYDADDQKDFVRGLGLEFDVPLREEIQNRHVRLAGDTGMWAEPVKPLMGRRVIESPAGGNVFPTQLAGKPVPPFAAFSAQGQVDINSRPTGAISVWRSSIPTVSRSRNAPTRRLPGCMCWTDAVAGRWCSSATQAAASPR